MACLDNALALTLGNPLAPLAILSYLNPARGSYTATTLNKNGGPRPVGQVHYRHGRRSARLAFLLPEDSAPAEDVVALLDQFAYEAGSWGALNILAELEEHSPLFEAFRKAGFVVYGRQQIWRIDRIPDRRPPEKTDWQPALSMDENAIRNLYQSLTPPLVQSAEACPESQEQCLVYRHDPDDLLAYAQVWLGPRGIYTLPLFHPGVTNFVELLARLVIRIAPQPARPLYMAVRSYQAGLESGLETLQASDGPRQVLMAKYLVNMQRLPVYNHARSVMEKRRAEPTTPIVTNMAQPPQSYPDLKKN